MNFGTTQLLGAVASDRPRGSRDRACRDDQRRPAERAPARHENPKGSCEIVNRKAPKASASRSEDREEKPAAEKISS
jgi:hypothetical protein